MIKTLHTVDLLINSDYAVFYIVVYILQAVEIDMAKYAPDSLEKKPLQSGAFYPHMVVSFH